MLVARRTRAITAQVEKSFDPKGGCEHVVLLPDDDLQAVHLAVVNLPDPYEGGVYFFRLTPPDDYPERPPELVALTPNGVYVPGGKICISVGSYHPTLSAAGHGWRKVLGLVGFAREVANGLIVPDALGHGLNIDVQGPAARRRLAAESAAYNRERFGGLVEAFEAAVAEHPLAPAAQGWRAAGALGALRAARAGASLAALCVEGGAAPLLEAALGPDWALAAGPFAAAADAAVFAARLVDAAGRDPAPRRLLVALAAAEAALGAGLDPAPAWDALCERAGDLCGPEAGGRLRAAGPAAAPRAAALLEALGAAEPGRRPGLAEELLGVL